MDSPAVPRKTPPHSLLRRWRAWYVKSTRPGLTKRSQYAGILVAVVFLLAFQVLFDALQNLDRLLEIVAGKATSSPVRLAYGDFQSQFYRINSVVIAPITETLAFMTLFQNLLALWRTTAKWRIPATTAVFVAWHVAGTGSLFDAAVLGLYVAVVGLVLTSLFESLGRGARATLWLIVVHAFSNAVQIQLALLVSGQGYEYWTSPWIEIRVVE